MIDRRLSSFKRRAVRPFRSDRLGQPVEIGGLEKVLVDAHDIGAKMVLYKLIVVPAQRRVDRQVREDLLQIGLGNFAHRLWFVQPCRRQPVLDSLKRFLPEILGRPVRQLDRLRRAPYNRRGSRRPGSSVGRAAD